MTPEVPRTFPGNVSRSSVDLRTLGSQTGFLQRAESFFHQWVRALGGSVSSQSTTTGNWWVERNVVLDGVLLKGFQHCPMIVSGSQNQPALLTTLASRTAIFIVSRLDVAEELENHPGSGYWVILDLDDVDELLQQDTQEQARQILLRHIRKQVDRRALIPFQTSRAVDGFMFQGRQEEATRLYHEQDTSFALVGPPRIGKTSLAQQFISSLSKNRDSRADRTYFVNLQNLSLCTDDAVALEIAKAIPHVQSRPVTSERLYEFLNQQAKSKGGAIQLVLDECDAVCKLWIFKQLCEWAKESDGPCRLIAMGKTHLARAVLAGGGNAETRLEPLRPRPLKRAEVWKLVSEPLKQLGLQFENDSLLEKEMWRRTAGLPHLAQGLGKALADASCTDGFDLITVERLNSAMSGVFGMANFRGHLHELGSLVAEIAGLAIVLSDGIDASDSWTARRLQAELLRYPVELGVESCMELLDELTLHHFLIWDKGTYLPGRWDFRQAVAQNRNDVAVLLREKLERYRKENPS